MLFFDQWPVAVSMEMPAMGCIIASGYLEILTLQIHCKSGS
jgi:hypothetical protein